MINKDIINKTPDLTFLTECHPEANGRQPVRGECYYSLYFTLENNKVLCIQIGKKGYNILQDFFKQMATEDLIEGLSGDML